MKQYNEALLPYAKELRKHMTPWERKLWYKFLNKYRPRFQRQKVLENFIADFYCAKAKLAIELDGSGHFNNKQRNCDKYRNEVMRLMDVKIIQIDNNDVYNYFDSVCYEIDRIVKERTSPRSASRTERFGTGGGGSHD